MIGSSMNINRRSVLQSILALPLASAVPRITEGHQLEGEDPQRPHHNPARHAVIVVSDPSVPRHAARRQREVLIEDGLHALGLRTDSCANISKVHGLASACNTLIAELRTDAKIKTITVLAWCEFASPLKNLPAATTADALAVRLFGTTAKIDDGIDDPAFIDSLPGPDAFFDCVLFAGDGYRPFVPRTDAAYMAYLLHAYRLGLDGRPYGVQFADSLDPAP